MRRLPVLVALVVLAVFFAVGGAVASTRGGDVRLTNDCIGPGCGAGYVSAYTLATGIPYTDGLWMSALFHRGARTSLRWRSTRGTRASSWAARTTTAAFTTRATRRAPIAVGPIWLGYYRSENGGASFVSSLVPGYPGDTPRTRALARHPHGQCRRPRDRLGRPRPRIFRLRELGRSSGNTEDLRRRLGSPFDNPGGPTGDPQNDGMRYRQTVVVARGSSAPNLLGKFNDKTAIEADHNSDGRCDDDVYFSWSRFTGNAGGVSIYFSRSTDHGVTFGNPMKVSQTISDVQFPDIAVTGNSNVYLVFRSFASGRGSEGNSIYYVRSTDCGATFTRPQLLQDFIPNDAQDVSDPEAAPPQSAPDDPGFEEEPSEAGDARDCGDFDAHCESGYTFFRRDTQPRATADQFDTANPDRFYVVYDATKPGTELPPGRHTGRPSQASAARPGSSSSASTAQTGRRSNQA